MIQQSYKPAYKMNTEKTAARILFDELRSIMRKNHFEYFYGETHIVEVSEARRYEDTGQDVVNFDDVYQEIRYRVYHKGDTTLPPCIFEILRSYDSDEGGCEYLYSSETWNDDEAIPIIPIEKALEFIYSIKGKDRGWSRRPNHLGKPH